MTAAGMLICVAGLVLRSPPCTDPAACRRRETCVNCLLCTAGCAYAGIVYEAEVGHVTKCDLCDGEPACVAACPSGALEYRTEGQIFNAFAEKEDL